MTKPHKFEVNSTKSRSLTHFEFLLDNKWSMSIKKILFKGLIGFSIRAKFKVLRVHILKRPENLNPIEIILLAGKTSVRGLIYFSWGSNF